MKKFIPALGIPLLIIMGYWVLDSWLDWLIMSGSSLSEQLLLPTSHQIVMRLLTGVILAGGFLLHRSFKEREHLSRVLIAQEHDNYLSLVENSSAGIIVHDGQGLQYANQNARDLLRLSGDEKSPPGNPLGFLPAEFKPLFDRLTPYIPGGPDQDLLEMEISRPDGEFLEIQASCSHVVWLGRPAQLTILRDITESNRTKRELIQAGDRFRLALDAVQDGVWDWDLELNRLVYNQTWIQMLGYQLDEVPDSLEFHRSLVHPDDLLHYQSAIDNHLEGFLPSCRIVIRLRHSDGHYIWVLDRGRIVKHDPQGKPLRMIGTTRDISSQIEAETALEVRNQVARIFLSEDSDSVYEDALALVCRNLGSAQGLLVRSDSLGQVHVLAAHPSWKGPQPVLAPSFFEQHSSLDSIRETVIQKGQTLLSRERLLIPQLDLELENFLGTPIATRSQAVGAILLADKDGGFLDQDRSVLESLAEYMAPILASRLVRESTEEQLRQAQKMEALGSLAGGIAHDFNNILQAIMGFSSLALEDAGPQGRVAHDLRKVLNATRRGQDLVQSILLFSRREDFQLQPVKMQDVVAEALTLLKPTIPATIEIRPRLDAEDLYVLGDPGQIGQVVINLATNAFQAMETDGGVLVIDLESSENRVPKPEQTTPITAPQAVLTVSDTGQGMSPEVQTRLFDPFFTTKEVGRGTGLGLSVVHGIIKAHRGNITVNSIPGSGTSVTVTLPLTGIPAADFQNEGEQSTLSYAPGSLKLALVDDEEDITELGQALLERMGFQVTVYNNGRELLVEMEADPLAHDLVITDLTMPQITGLQLAHRLEMIAPGTPVILITGIADEKSVDWTAHANIKGLVLKPFRADDLKAMIGQVMKRYGQLKGN